MMIFQKRWYAPGSSLILSMAAKSCSAQMCGSSGVKPSPVINSSRYSVSMSPQPLSSSVGFSSSVIGSLLSTPDIIALLWRFCLCIRMTIAGASGTITTFTEVDMGAPHGVANGKFRHGHNGRDGQSPTYKCWDNMISRCHRPNHNAYPQYGGRGITVCERWRHFDGFLADMGERPSLDHSIDRIDSSRGYEPGNCRWATRSEQARNSGKVKTIIRSDGRRYETAIDAATDVGVDYSSIVKVCRGQRKSAGGFGWKYEE